VAKTKSITLYSFDELDETIQEQIISEYIQNLPGWWSDDIEERIKHEAEAIGIKNFEFGWSGFWSQGDGLSFTGDLDFKTWLYILQNRFPNWADDKDNSRTNNGYKILGLSLTDVISAHERDYVNFGECRIYRHNTMYCHENTIEVLAPLCDVLLNSKHFWEDYRLKFCGNAKVILNEWKDTLCLRWYNELQDEYESFTQRENIIEEIVSKTLLFTKTGHIITESELV
jgi:hypothetical protein|tara:strand:- start:1046 stop:1729 length:684 start_codon:yes stop_codon:yes gene_type:complete